jgi:hypothetical protein
VLLKRGLSATIEEWLMSAEYIFSEGNDQVVLCERGIRTFERYTRNTLDLSAIPIIKQLSHLPVVVDPSHATGMREKVAPMARSAIAAGADGLMIEVHNEPDKALSDGAQSLYPKQFGQLMRDIYVIAPVVGKQLEFSYAKKEHLLNKEPKKSSLILSTVNQAGGLYRTLKVLADQGINLVKLESRRIPGKPWEYMFYVDLEEDVESPDFEPVLQALAETTDYLKVLGSY